MEKNITTTDIIFNFFEVGRWYIFQPHRYNDIMLVLAKDPRNGITMLKLLPGGKFLIAWHYTTSFFGWETIWNKNHWKQI